MIKLFIFRKKYRNKNLIRRLSRLPLLLALLSILAFIYDFGFEHDLIISEWFSNLYLTTAGLGAFSVMTRYFFDDYRPKRKRIPYDLALFAFLVTLVLKHYGILDYEQLKILDRKLWLHTAIFLVFIREFAALRLEFKKALLNPAQIFILSFLSIIVLGSFLLLLPNATVSSISLTDALFTSTSAVCVTGLVVVDTGSTFTPIGQIIIAVLIQIGGLGIMTFASYFSYFFKGSASYESQLVLRDIVNADKLSEVFSILKVIVGITFLIEGAGAAMIYYSLDPITFANKGERLFFSLFHAISGFCNAGFSTLPNNFYEQAFRFNYPLHLITASLIILGGIGFPIVYNLLKFLRMSLIGLALRIAGRTRRIFQPRLINVNTRLVLVTSMLLLVLGTFAFLIPEYNNTLSEHTPTGKIVTAFFSATTTRTAGFNTVDFSTLSVPATLLVMVLMWIGASPASTGGGIKTSTFALALLNAVSIAKGKSRLELFNREIPANSINRAFAIIVLSIIVISVSTLLIALFDTDKGLLNICFESVSAYSTVGLSRGITASLSMASKIVLIFTMFIGRVGMLTLLIAVFRKHATGPYRLPTENILIN